MKKFFTLVTMAMLALAAQADDITIYVQAETAPYLYWWNASETTTWPGEQLTEKQTVKNPTTNEDMTFWVRTITGASAAGVNIIFNNGAGKQTGNITGLIVNSYFTYDGETEYEDITAQFGKVPDAVITGVTLPGNHNGWDIANSTPFTAVEEGKVYTLGVDLTDVTVDDDVWLFKLGVNASAWVGYYQVTLDAPDYVVEAMENSNFEIDLAEVTEKKFTITATWAGGKKADEGWTVKIEEGITNGVNVLKVNNADNAVYDLQGRRAENNAKGLFIINGKKVIR